MFRQIPMSSRACMLIKAIKHLLSDEELDQFRRASKRYLCE